MAEIDGRCLLIRGAPLKTVVAPVLAADTMMGKEQPVRVVMPLDDLQPLVILAPIRVLPILFKKVALRDIGSGLRHDLAQLPHRVADYRRLAACLDKVRRKTGNAGIGRRPIAADQRQAKGAEHRRVRCSVARRGDGIVGRAGQSFLELYLKPPMPGRGKQRVSDAALLVGLEQRCRQPQSLKAAPERADLVMVAGPREITGVRPRPRVADDGVGRVFLAKLRVPPVARCALSN